MKKFYFLFVAMMAMLFSMPASAQDGGMTEISLTIDHPEAVLVFYTTGYGEDRVQHDYEMKEGKNVFEVPNGEYLNINVIAPWKFVKIVDGDGAEQNFYGSSFGFTVGPTSWNPNPMSTYVITTVNMDEARTGTFDMDVDVASMVNVKYLPGNDPLIVKDGENQYKFDPENEKQLMISPTAYGVPLYAVYLNDELLSPNPEPYGGIATQYTVDLTEGCKIKVVGVYPEGDVTVSFNLLEDALKAIKEVKVNNEPLENFDGTALTLPIGTPVKVDLNVNEYNIKTASINGVAQVISEYNTMLDFVALHNTEVEIDAAPYSTYDINVTVTGSDLFTLYPGTSYYGVQPLEIVDGTQTITLTEKITAICWVVKKGAFMKSITLNGEEQPCGEYYTYLENLKDGDEIVFNCAEPEKIEVSVNATGADLIDLYTSQYPNNGTRVDLVEGENTVYVYENDPALNWRASTGAYIESVTLNGDTIQGAFVTDLKVGDKLEIVAKPYELDQVAVVYVEDFKMFEPIDGAYASFAFGGNEGGRIELNTGYNVVNYYSAMNPFYCSATMNNGEYPIYYLNDEELTCEWGYASFTLPNESVFKVFTSGSAPEPVTLTTDVEDGLNPVVKRDIIKNVQLDAEETLLAGTLVTITPSEGENYTVKVNGLDLSANGEGIFEFTLAENTAVEISNYGTGVAAIGAAANSNAVFNLQGIKVADSDNFNTLPAGIYVVNGKKVVKK